MVDVIDIYQQRGESESPFTPEELVHLEPRPWALGSGLQLGLLLPVEPDAMVAQRVNANERLEPDAHQLGAWCVDKECGLMFPGFVPAAAHMPACRARSCITCPPRMSGRAR